LALTDYNKVKKLEPTSQNDSGSTINKAQPILLKGEEGTYDVNSAVFNQSLDTSSEEDVPTGLEFNDDGTKMYVIGNSNAIYSYNLSTAFDISTASFNQSFDVSNEESIPWSLAFNNDGTKMYIVGTSTTDVHSYTLSTAYDIGTASFNQQYNITKDAGPLGITFNNDGTKMFIAGDQFDSIYSYNLSTAFDIGTASFNQSFDVSGQVSNTTSVIFNDDGTKMVVLDDISDTAYNYDLSTGFDVSTAVPNQSKDLASEDDTVNSISFGEDGSKLFVLGNQNDNVYSYDLDVVGDQTTGTGDIVIDFANIAGAEDIAVYDESDNLLDYEIEELDTTNETGVIWVYNDWTRDDTVQAKLAYGDNSANTDRQNVTETWNNTGQNAVMVQHLNGNAADSTSNNNDGTINGASSGATGQFNGAYSFDEIDDDIDIGSIGLGGDQSRTLVTWFKHPSRTGGNYTFFYMGDRGTTNHQWDNQIRDDQSSSPGNGEIRVAHWSNDYTGEIKVDDGSWHNFVCTYSSTSNALKTYVDATLDIDQSDIGTLDTQDNDATIGSIKDDESGNNDDINHFGGDIDEVRIYSDVKNSDWSQADYDASPKAGQIFFSQNAAETTITTETATLSTDVSIKNRGVKAQLSQDLIVENQDIPETFTQDVNVQATDQTATFSTNTAIKDKDVEQTFTQDTTVLDRDVEKTFDQSVSVKLEDKQLTFDQDLIISEPNVVTHSQDVSVKAENVTKQFSQDLIVENINIPEVFTQDVSVADKDVEKTFAQEVVVSRQDEEETFTQDAYVSERQTLTFENTVVVAKQPAPDVNNPLTVKVLQPTSTYVKNLNPSKTKVKIKDVDL